MKKQTIIKNIFSTRKDSTGSNSKKGSNPTLKQRINERFPNENIFKNELKYRLKKNLEFDSQIENSNFFFDASCRKYGAIKLLMFFFSLKIISFSDFSEGKLFFYITLLQILPITYCFYLVFISEKIIRKQTDFEKFERNFILLRIILEVICNIEIYKLVCFEGLDKISFQNCVVFFLYPFLYNVCFNLPLILSALIYFEKMLFMLCILNHPESHVLKRLFSNLLSKEFLILTSSFLIAFFSEYIIKRNFSELWALYDSFKRSYHVIKKCLYEENPNPIFIIQRKQLNANNNILFKNPAAEKLFEIIKLLKSQKLSLTKLSNNCDPKDSLINTSIFPSSNIHMKRSMNMPAAKKAFLHLNNLTACSSNSPKGDPNSSGLSSLFHKKEFEDLFFREIENCLNSKKKSFEFPLRLGAEETAVLKFKESARKIAFFEGDFQSFEWFKVFVSLCSWKSQEAVCLQFFKNCDFQKDEFVSSFLSNLSFEFNNVIESVDKCCDAVAEADYMIEKLERSSQILQNLNNTPGPLGGLRNRSYITPPGHIYKNSSLPRNNNIHNKLFLNKTHPERDVSNYIASVGYPHYDYSIWFFLKTNANLLYDYFLGISFFNEVSAKRFKRFDYKLISLKTLIRYFDDNFYTLSRVKNWNINSSFVSCDGNYNGLIKNESHWLESKNSERSFQAAEEEIYIVHSYTRVLLFNLYLFILSSSEDTTTEKDFVINFSLEKNPAFSKEKASDMIYNNNNLNITNNNGLNNKTININNKSSSITINSNFQNFSQPYESDMLISISLTASDPKPKYNFNKLNEIISKANLLNNLPNQLSFISNLDCKLMFIGLICKKLFDSHFSLSRDQHGKSSQNSDASINNNENSEVKRKSSEISEEASKINQRIEIKIPVISSKAAEKLKTKINFEDEKCFVEKNYLEPKENIFEDYYLKILEKTYKCHKEAKLKSLYKVKNFESNEYLETGATNNEDTNLNESYLEDTDYAECVKESESFNKKEECNYSLEEDLLMARQIKLHKEFSNQDLSSKIESKDEIKDRIIMKSPFTKTIPLPRPVKTQIQECWDYCSLKSKVKYFFPPRFLIVEDNVIGRSSLINILKKQKLNYLIDVAAYGRESIQKFKFFLNKGFLYDIIFMDINLPDMLGSEATEIMRKYESEYSSKKTTIIAVTVEGKKNVKMDDLFNDYFEKPIKSSIFTECISKHFKINRPDIENI